MKNNQLTFILVGILFLSALATTALTYKYIYLMRQLPNLQVKMVILKNTQNFMNQLLTDSSEYAKKDKEIEPLLQSVIATPANSEVMLPPKAPAK